VIVFLVAVVSTLFCPETSELPVVVGMLPVDYLVVEIVALHVECFVGVVKVVEVVEGFVVENDVGAEIVGTVAGFVVVGAEIVGSVSFVVVVAEIVGTVVSFVVVGAEIVETVESFVVVVVAEISEFV